MTDLAEEMNALGARLGPPPGAICRVVQFMAAEPGEGVSTTARSFAWEMAKTATRPVWLIELDLLSGAQWAAINAEPETFGRLGDPTRSSPDNSAFFEIAPKPSIAGRPVADAAFLAAYTVGNSRMLVTRFRSERLETGHQPRLTADPQYWRTLRKHSSYVVIDAPAWTRSRAAALIAPHVDDNLIVVRGDRRQPAKPIQLKEAITATGAALSGLVVSRAPKEPPGFLSALLA